MLVKSLLSKLSLVISQISDPPAELDGSRGDLFKAAGGEGRLIFIVLNQFGYYCDFDNDLL